MSVGKTGVPERRDTVSVWRVFLPSDLDRGEYIKNCYLTGTVSLINSNAEILGRVRIGKMALQLIDFPLNNKTFGSEVLCVTLPYSGEIRVIDVYSSKTEFSLQKEHQYRFYKTNNGETAEILIDGNRGKVGITVDSDDTGGELSISVTNENRSAKMNVSVNGEIMIVNDGNTTIQSSNQIQLEQYDAQNKEKTTLNVKKDLIKAVSKKIALNEPNEPMLLGDKTVSLLSDLLDILVSETAGPYPLRGTSQYSLLKDKLEELKSKLSFLE